MKKHVLDSLETESWVYLKPSTVCDGVGVFALRDIPDNTYLFYDMAPDVDFFRWDMVSHLHPNVITQLKNLCMHNEDGFYLSRTYNNMSFSHYVNHSDTPNAIYLPEIKRWKTSKAISTGEEILTKYNSHNIDW
jgi:SET domain-containing protein